MSVTIQQLPFTETSENSFSLLTDLTNITLGSDNVSTIANMVLDIVVRYISAKKCSLMLLNDRRELSIVASRGIDLDTAHDNKPKGRESVAGTVLKEFNPILVADISQEERFRPLRRGNYTTPSFISCPIKGRKNLLGVLNASERTGSKPFTDHEFDLMKLIAQQAAIALENAFLMADLKDKAAELEDMNRKLMEGDALKTEFLTRVSHELRTPLNSIKGSIYYLQNSEALAKSEQNEFYSIIAKETDKLASLVENQLDFLVFEDEMRCVKTSVISITELLNDVASSIVLSDKLSSRNLRLAVLPSETVAEVIGDKITLFQMFINLLEGLMPFMTEGSDFRIETSGRDFVTITVHGSSSLPNDIHEAFSRPDHSVRQNVGDERLKLYLAKKAAELHGWSQTIENTSGGFTITITVPRSKRQKLDAAIGTSINLFLEFIAELMGLKTCSVMLRDDTTGELRIQSALGLSEDIVKRTRIRPGDQISGWVALEGKPILIEDIEHDPRFARRNTSQYNTKSLLSIPLKVDNTVLGVLNLNNKKSAEPFTPQDLSIAAVLGARISHLIDKLRKEDCWEDGFRNFTASFDKLLSAGRKYQKKISRFGTLVSKIMERLEAQDTEKDLALYAASVYDLGLMLMGEEVLLKKKLAPAELASLKVHPYTTVELLSGIEFSPEVKKAILHHHEKFDGTGYPDGLAGEAIPLISRVIAVVDSYCAMTSKRPHRLELPAHEALREIQNGAGTSYDPTVVAALGSILAVQGLAGSD
jgi:GAF domain-containing protein